MHAINQIINVNAFYFDDAFKDTSERSRRGQQQQHRQVKAFPRQIEFGNTQYTFTNGLQRLVQHGQRVVQLFDMTDGRTRFRLAQEDGQWTLLGTKSMQVGA
jgi:hypothetical protein